MIDPVEEEPGLTQDSSLVEVVTAVVVFVVVGIAECWDMFVLFLWLYLIKGI